MLHKLMPWVFICSFVMPVAGCSWLTSISTSFFEDPKFSLESLKIKKMGLENIDLELSVAVENPNRFHLYLRSLQYTLHQDQLLLAEAELDQEQKVSSRSKQQILIPIQFRSRALIQVISSYFLGKATEKRFKFSAQATISSFWGSRHFDVQEDFELSELLKGNQE